MLQVSSINTWEVEAGKSEVQVIFDYVLVQGQCGLHKTLPKKKFSWCQVFDEDASYSRVTLWSSTHVGVGENSADGHREARLEHKAPLIHGIFASVL